MLPYAIFLVSLLRNAPLGFLIGRALRSAF